MAVGWVEACSGPRCPRAVSNGQQARIQVAPIRVGVFDQGELPRPQPALDPLFAQDGLVDVAVVLISDQTVRSPLPAVAIDLTVFVFADPPDQIVGHPDI